MRTNLWKGYEYHNLTKANYEQLLDSQDNRCAICHTEIRTVKIHMSVDHDHNCCPGQRSCGKCIRGLLCRSCNAGLGFFKDNVGILLGAIRYLQTWTPYKLEDSLEVLEEMYEEVINEEELLAKA